MSRVAVATCRGDGVDPDSPLLLEALAREGIRGELAVWDDPRVNWDAYDLVVVRSTWDYASRVDEFLDWAQKIPQLLNPFEVISFSVDKHYLAELARRGVRTVETLFVDVGSSANFPTGDFVVKPTVGAGSMEAARYRADETRAAQAHVDGLHRRGRDVMVQPYVSSVDELGESALVYIDGELSHVMTKGAMLNVDETDRHALFRREQMSIGDISTDARLFADQVLETANASSLLYARVDVVQIPDGFALMELELVEPSLFLTFVPDAALRLASAIRRRVDTL